MAVTLKGGVIMDYVFLSCDLKVLKNKMGELQKKFLNFKDFILGKGNKGDK